MSQLQVTGEAKIRAIQGPVVANSGVITALNGAADQYVRGDGTLAQFPTVTGGGSSVSYYLNGSVNQGTFADSTYYEMSEDAITGVGTNFSTSTNGLLAQFITDAGVPDVTEIPSGNWNVEFYMSVSASSGSLASFYVEIYKWDGSTFTLIASNSASPEFLTNTTTVDAYFTSVAMPTTALSVTDRLAIRVYANVASKTVTLYTEDNRLCQVVTTFSKGMLSLNNLTDQSQYLTVGTAGTDFNIVSSGDTHTFNIPSASASNRGLITTGSQTIAGAKTFSSSIIGDAGIRLKEGVITSAEGYTGLVGDADGLLITKRIDSTAYTNLLYFNSATSNTYTFPDLSGTLALTSDLGGYVPYTGATGNLDLGGHSLYLNNSQAVFGRNTSGTTDYPLIGVNSSNKVSIDTSGLGSIFGGSVNLGSNALFAQNIVIGQTSTQGYIHFKTGGSTAISADTCQAPYGTNGMIYSFDQTSSNYKQFVLDSSLLTNNTIRTYSMPNASGTLALTSNLSIYVPYTGATANVDLGAYSITTTGSSNAQIFYANGNVSNAGQISMKWGTGFASPTGYSTLGGFNNGFILISNIGGNQKLGIFDLSSLTTGTQRTYTLPDASGTIALLSGTQTFTGKVIVNTGGIDNQIAAIGTAPSLRLANAVTGATINGFIAMAGSTSDYISGSVAGDMCIGNQNSGKIIYGFGSGTATALMTITSTGLGIGTSSPARPLHIVGTSGDTYARTSNTAGGSQFGVTSNGDGIFESFTSGKSTLFWTGGSERMRITSGGNVGIGTSSPESVLTVQKNTAGGRGGEISIVNYATQTLGNEAALNFGLEPSTYGTNDGNAQIKAIITNGSNAGTDIVFSNWSGSAFSERMRITSGGNVLIGTTSQTYATKLEVVSTGDAISSKCDNGGTAILCNPANTGSNSAYFKVGSTNAGYIGHPTSSTTSYNTSPSDERLKYNIEEWNENVLESFKAIKPKTYAHIADEDETIRYKGYIAQEMIDKFPEAYPIDRDGFYNYNPSAMVVYLTKAIQELKAEIDQLKAT